MKKMIPLMLAVPMLVAGCGGGDSKERVFFDSEPRAFYTVEYDISTTPASSDAVAYVTYTSPGQTSELHKIHVPTTIKAPLMFEGSELYVSAQNPDSSPQSTVSVVIRVNGVPYRRASASGPYALATASGTCCNNPE